MDSNSETAPTPEKKEKKYGKFDDWEIKDAADTLSRAEEIKADAEKMKYVATHMEEKMGHMQKTMGAMKEVSSIDDLKEIRKNKIKKDSE